MGGGLRRGRVERVRRERRADNRLVDYAAQTRKRRITAEVGGRYRWITARLRQMVGRVSVERWITTKTIVSDHGRL